MSFLCPSILKTDNSNQGEIASQQNKTEEQKQKLAVSEHLPSLPLPYASNSVNGFKITFFQDKEGFSEISLVGAGITFCPIFAIIESSVGVTEKLAATEHRIRTLSYLFSYLTCHQTQDLPNE